MPSVKIGYFAATLLVEKSESSGRPFSLPGAGGLGTALVFLCVF